MKTKTQPTVIAKHTPGPWAAYVNDSRGYACGISAAGDQLPGGYEVIAQVIDPHESHFPGGVPEAEANARLIAAAPDLLEVVQRLARWNSNPNGNGIELDRICKAAKTAAAKATN